uniref:Uncharacterized protein n=1 Tax=Brassica campestris TaxID=3711 RepID=M4FHU3_BRACM
MLNKFKHSKAEQTTLASKLPSSQLNYPQQDNRRKKDRLRIIGGHLNLAAEEKAPKRNGGVVWSTNKDGRGGPLMDLVDDLNP